MPRNICIYLSEDELRATAHALLTNHGSYAYATEVLGALLVELARLGLLDIKKKKAEYYDVTVAGAVEPAICNGCVHCQGD